ncbi:hypothetical protein [Kocuria sp. ZOR0020]|uniref:hypothetical protein n=1 Tax=Kocuria sp. ZOR0020 TaxID=1339234 RepID=UPI000645A8D7|nr:hypothetical protein [Kocuria sp. ZOR0020]
MTAKTIETYLQDHYAGSTAGTDAFRRVADGHGDPEVRSAVERMAGEIEQDQEALEAIMAAFGVKADHLKNLPAKVGEKVARLKLNERITKRSPLSDVLELEVLSAAVHTKSLGWRLLMEVPDSRLDQTQLEDLHNRAENQQEELERLRLKQAHKLAQA